jgi:hypothetical protein
MLRHQGRAHVVRMFAGVEVGRRTCADESVPVLVHQAVVPARASSRNCGLELERFVPVYRRVRERLWISGERPRKLLIDLVQLRTPARHDVSQSFESDAHFPYRTRRLSPSRSRAFGLSRVMSAR